MPDHLHHLIAKAEKNSGYLKSYFFGIMSFVSDGSKTHLSDALRDYQQFAETIEYEDSRLAFYQGIMQATLDYWSGSCELADMNFDRLLESPVDGSSDVVGLTHMLAGGNLRSLGEFDRAVSHLLKARELIDSKSEIGTYAMYAHYQLGEIHRSLEDYSTAEKHYRDGLEMAGENPNGLFRLHSGMGSVYLVLGDFPRAEKHLDKALDVAGSAGQKGRILYDLGCLAEAQEHFAEAEELARKSYKLRMNNKLPDAASTSQILIARTQMRQGDQAAAIENLQEALLAVEEFEAVTKKMEIHRLISMANEHLGDFKTALTHFKDYERIKDSINSEQQREIFKMKNAQIEEQRLELAERNQEITDSIRYAQRIQSAILPPDRLVREHLSNAFILYKPKDIVAGDFYWLEPVGETVLFAAADCTGHGVPGAMVSVVCVHALNRSVREFGLTDPGQILDKTRELVIEEFEKSDEEVKDGMDISLCTLGPIVCSSSGAYRELKWAGANNPLWIVRASETSEPQLEEIKADKQPIGQYDLAKPFTTHELRLNQGDTLYIFSDGFADQFGGENGKKYKSGKLKRTLTDLATKPIDTQEEALVTEFEHWKGSLEQVDDVCLIGVKL